MYVRARACVCIPVKSHKIYQYVCNRATGKGPRFETNAKSERAISGTSQMAWKITNL